MTEHRNTIRPRPRARFVLAGIAACTLGLTGVAVASGAGATAQTTRVNQAAPSRQPYVGTFAPPGTTTTTTESTATAATTAQETGLVYINTTLDYGTGEAAGTGMILTSDGEILTNHHVVEGATAIKVEVVTTGQTYSAEVVGYDSTHDVAVLQLKDASGLTPVTTDTSQDVAAGDAITGVGNANGTGGTASASAGTVVALDQSITVSSETGGAATQLTGLIEIDADIISGDSGGALYDADGEVIGMNTAASRGTADVTGYAIPISQALTIADQIDSGVESTDVQIGNRGYLGIELSPQVTGALVAGVVTGSAAEDAGLVAGSTITSLNGSSITSAQGLSEDVAGLDQGDRVTLAWTDTSGQAHNATVTLGSGPVG